MNIRMKPAGYCHFSARCMKALLVVLIAAGDILGSGAVLADPAVLRINRLFQVQNGAISATGYTYPAAVRRRQP